MVKNCCGSMISEIDTIAVLLVIILGTVFGGSRKIKKNGIYPILLIIISAGAGIFFYGFR